MPVLAKIAMVIAMILVTKRFFKRNDRNDPPSSIDCV